jgi:glycyl-tRNA synthetase beta chain
LPLRLSEIMADARTRYRGSEAAKKFSNAAYEESVRSFFRERLEFYLKDAGYVYDVINAVLAADADDVVDAIARAEAVKNVLHLPEFQAIAAACKRMKNILRQAGEKGITVGPTFKYLPDSAHEEKNLAAYIKNYHGRIEGYRAKREYGDALLLLSTVRETVDAFFDKVMVMVDDDNLRANRLALLQSVVKEFSTVADFSEIVTEGKESTK